MSEETTRYPRDPVADTALYLGHFEGADLYGEEIQSVNIPGDDGPRAIFVHHDVRLSARVAEGLGGVLIHRGGLPVLVDAASSPHLREAASRWTARELALTELRASLDEAVGATPPPEAVYSFTGVGNHIFPVMYVKGGSAVVLVRPVVRQFAPNPVTLFGDSPSGLWVDARPDAPGYLAIYQGMDPGALPPEESALLVEEALNGTCSSGDFLSFVLLAAAGHMPAWQEWIERAELPDGEPLILNLFRAPAPAPAPRRPTGRPGRPRRRRRSK